MPGHLWHVPTASNAASNAESASAADYLLKPHETQPATQPVAATSATSVAASASAASVASVARFASAGTAGTVGTTTVGTAGTAGTASHDASRASTVSGPDLNRFRGQHRG